MTRHLLIERPGDIINISSTGIRSLTSANIICFKIAVLGLTEIIMQEGTRK
jgi:hypothetical protein